MALLLPSNGEYQTEFDAGWIEGLAQEVDVFNQKSNGALLLGSEIYKGSYYKEAGYDRIADLVQERDVTSNAAVTPKTMSLLEHVGVDKAMRIGPVKETHENFNRRGVSVDEFAFTIGRQAAGDYLKKALDHTVAALIGSTPAAMTDATANTATTNYKHLLKGMRKFGDQQAAVAAILMNSEAWYDLREDGLDNYKIDDVAGMQIVTGYAGAMGKPIIVSDIAALNYDSGSSDYKNRIFFLRQGAVSVEQRGPINLVVKEDETGNENIQVLYQSEYNYLIKVLGRSWIPGTGGINPSEAALATAANWTSIFDNKLTAASLVETESA